MAGQDPPDVTLPELELRYVAVGGPAPPPPPEPTGAPVEVSCGMVIEESIRVANDLSGCLGEALIVGVPNIVLDLNGKTITSGMLLEPGEEDGLLPGIRNGHPNVVIRNGTVRNFGYGVLLGPGATRNVVHGMTLFGNVISGNSFVAKSDDGSTEAEGTLSRDGVTGTVELPGGTRVRYEAGAPSGAAGLYDLTVSSKGDLSGVSAAGLGVTGEVELRGRRSGMLKLADGGRLEFDVVGSPAGDLIRLRAGQLRLIVLPGGEVRGTGKSRLVAGDGDSGFFVRSSST